MTLARVNRRVMGEGEKRGRRIEDEEREEGKKIAEARVLSLQ